MKSEQRECGECNAITEHTKLGFVPQVMFEDTESCAWVKATLCERCATLNVQDISEREMDWAERRFLWALVDGGNMSKEEAEEILNS